MRFNTNNFRAFRKKKFNVEKCFSSFTKTCSTFLASSSRTCRAENFKCLSFLISCNARHFERIPDEFSYRCVWRSTKRLPEDCVSVQKNLIWTFIMKEFSGNTSGISCCNVFNDMRKKSGIKTVVDYLDIRNPISNLTQSSRYIINRIFLYTRLRNLIPINPPERNKNFFD